MIPELLAKLLEKYLTTLYCEYNKSTILWKNKNEKINNTSG